MTRRRALTLAGSLGVAAALSTSTSKAASVVQTSNPILFTRFAAGNGLRGGTFADTLLDETIFVVALADGATSGTWESPWVDPGFVFTRLVPSWNAATPGASWLQVEVAAETTAGELTPWYTLGIWADGDTSVTRRSVPGQTDAHARVDTDTLVARGLPFVGYALRVTLVRADAAEPSPTLHLIGAMAADVRQPLLEGAPRDGYVGGVELAVPPYSQEIHAQHYPQWGGGGEVWCSPTSTQMIVAYWGAGPSDAEMAWVGPSHQDPSVDFAARHTFDATYRGTGNWPFNTAYAARFGLQGFVTQLRSLAEAERFIRAGIPLAMSIQSGPGELDGFLFWGGTNGHLVVIVGFDSAGNPIVNDPAAWTNPTVRRLYRRDQFERAWLRGSSGTVYVIHPLDVPLPAHVPNTTPNW